MKKKRQAKRAGLKPLGPVSRRSCVRVALRYPTLTPRPKVSSLEAVAAEVMAREEAVDPLQKVVSSLAHSAHILKEFPADWLNLVSQKTMICWGCWGHPYGSHLLHRHVDVASKATSEAPPEPEEPQAGQVHCVVLYSHSLVASVFVSWFWCFLSDCYHHRFKLVQVDLQIKHQGIWWKESLHCRREWLFGSVTLSVAPHRCQHLRTKVGSGSVCHELWIGNFSELRAYSNKI